MKAVPRPRTGDTPLISVLMVARNSAAFIADALSSARRQTIDDIEIVVVDDGSTDDTFRIALEHARDDARVRLFTGPGRGLSAVRNTSLRHARGAFGAILDSDDLLHPRHLELLLERLRQFEAHVAVANMVSFVDETHPASSLFAAGPDWRYDRVIEHVEFVQSGTSDADEPSLGYLKPLFSLDFLRAKRLSYNEDIRIGEDFDLLDRALECGATLAYSAAPTYFYRRHEQSTSHRLQARDVEALLEADRPHTDAAVARAARKRRYALKTELAHIEAVEAIKRRALAKAAAACRDRPAVLRRLLGSAFEGITRRAAKLGSRIAGRLLPSRGQIALVIGTPPTKESSERLASCLRQRNLPVKRVDPKSYREAVELGQIARPIGLIVTCDDLAAESAPFALRPGTPVCEWRANRLHEVTHLVTS
ncbi:glycosyltransferase family 2 protein [Aurantiacibacter poecillastricola]|uniref:glycosyltransferase family 2 protein n=1 Tax=Aurantiacibacter poecillastricola TaxID=3064385 RepID=UPI00273D6126|nr:glycosyltransferase family 2 protein [Aurantiacibacter sp. 219JJ12-13]MDP5263221.1 glycosyltransferase family 2 protein [Aurantiacibacter sp. 219JJ12-13]